VKIKPILRIPIAVGAWELVFARQHFGISHFLFDHSLYDFWDRLSGALLAAGATAAACLLVVWIVSGFKPETPDTESGGP
jgi:hypothetical protein